MKNLKNIFNKNISKLFSIFLLLFAFIVPINSTYSFDYQFHSNRYCICFSPKGNCQDLINYRIDVAEKQILIAAYSFTNFSILEHLVKAKNRGVKIYVILYKSKQNYKAYYFLKNNQIPVKLRRYLGLMHNKFIVFDNNIIETGSYNYTYSANNKNDENMIFIRSRIVNRKYTEYFWYLWNTTNP
jgi:phosphatidylserine/phosphatidylglycerophosphate/cardiolipin synthase-like enzyme